MKGDTKNVFAFFNYNDLNLVIQICHISNVILFKFNINQGCKVIIHMLHN